MSTFDLIARTWKWDFPALAAALAASIAYLYALRSKLGARAIYFFAAILVFILALASPVGALADGYLFSAHMLQHLLLVLVVPPLALLGMAPSTGLTAGVPSLKARVPGMVTWGHLAMEPRPSGRRIRRIPAIVAWGLGVGAMWLWHAPTLCNAAAQSAVVHRLQELSLLAMGTAFFWPVMSPRARDRMQPLPAMAYLFTACVACTILGIIVTFSPVEVCSVFASPKDTLGIVPTLRDGWGLTTAEDQKIGGLLMWVPACLVYAIAILGTLARMYREEPQAEAA
jgi:cytochrome c oxidase assembly factor CtaG